MRVVGHLRANNLFGLFILGLLGAKRSLPITLSVLTSVRLSDDITEVRKAYITSHGARIFYSSHQFELGTIYIYIYIYNHMYNQLQ